MRLDLRADVGVPGWLDADGRHYRLADVATPERVAEHRAATVTLALAALKLAGELEDASSGVF